MSFQVRLKDWKLHEKIIASVAILFTAYQLFATITGFLEPLIHRPIHLGFVLALVYLKFPLFPNKVTFVDWLLSIAAFGVCLYPVIHYHELIWAFGKYSTLDLTVAFAGVFLVLEACRRVVGWPLLVLVVAFVLYAVFGNHFPGFLSHKGFGIARVVARLFYTTEGIPGIPLGASATYIFLFLLFGAMLQFTGVSDYFIKLALYTAGHATGGPAKVAVIGSGLFGSISGSAVANVMGTGSFTIPMMKKLGYRAEFAGAVEAAASTGGQLMPPVMGTAAFLMSEFLGVSYWTIVKAAAIPGILYYLSCYCSVHFEAKKLGLKGLPKEDLPERAEIVRSLYLMLPLIAVIALLAMGFTPTRSALYSMGVCLVVGVINPQVHITVKGILNVFRGAAEDALGVAVATANAGIIVGVVTLTGLGIKMGAGLVALAHGHLFVTLCFVAVTSLILGMGVPTAPNYVITSMVAAPALLKLGVNPIAAHMFVLYFGIISDVTPPVCLSALAASSIAKSNPIKTGVLATRNAVSGFLIPFVFVLSPMILLIGNDYRRLLFDLPTATLGIVGISAAMAGYFMDRLGVYEIALLIAGGIMAVYPANAVSLVGVLVIFLVFGTQVLRHRKTFQAN